MAEAPDRNLALELVRVTEAAAMAAGRWVGRGDKNGADGAAVNAMRKLISSVSMNGVVVIGEGEKDDAPMLFNGEQVGDGTGPECDVAVDPIDGTTLTAKGMPNAIAVLAVAERGTMYDPSAVFYMEKLVTGPEAADVVDINAPVAREHPPASPRPRASTPRTSPSCILDRPRHEELVEEIREHRRPDQVHLRRRRRRRDHGRPRGHRRRPAARHRRHARGHHRRLRDEVPRRRDPGQAVAAGRRRAAQGARRRARPRPGAAPPTTWSPATTCSSSPPASPTASCCAGCATSAGGATTHSLVMRSKSGTIRSIEQRAPARASCASYAAVDFEHAT